MKPTVHFGAVAEDGESFFQRCMRAAAALCDAGLGQGEVVAVLLRNEPVLLELMLAARWIGARWCLVNWHFKAGEVRHILADSQARMLVVHADLLAPLQGAVAPGARVFVATPHGHTRCVFGLPVESPLDGQRPQ